MLAMDVPVEIISMIVDCMDIGTSVKFMLTCHQYADVYFARDSTVEDIIVELRWFHAYSVCRCGRTGDDVECGICAECLPQTKTCDECGRVNFREFFQHGEYNMPNIYSYESTICHRNTGCQFACNKCGKRRPSIHDVLVNHDGDVYCKDCVRSDPSLQQEPLYHEQFYNGRSMLADFTTPHWYTRTGRMYAGPPLTVLSIDNDGVRYYAEDTVDPAQDKYLQYVWIFHVPEVSEVVTRWN